MRLVVTYPYLFASVNFTGITMVTHIMYHEFYTSVYTANSIFYFIIVI